MEKGMFDLDQEKNTCRILLHFVRLSGLAGLFNKSTTIFHGLHSSGLLIFRAVADPRNSGFSAKSREIPPKTRNTAKSARNISKYLSAKHI